MRPIVIVSTALLISSSGSGARPAPVPFDVTPLSSPAGPGTGQPQLSASDRGVLLSWIERAGTRATLKFAERTSSGWTGARVVASGDDWFVNWADVPSVMRLSDGTLAAHWLQKSGPGTYAYDVRLSHSSDDGRTWSAPFTPHHDGTDTEHGFASLFQMPGAGLGLVWLDGRAMGPETAGHASGAMSIRFASFDGSWKQTTESLVDSRVCECCPTTAAVTAEGPIVAFRNRSDEEVRDIYVSRFDGRTWSEPKPVHDDGWAIHACPVNGPMLSAKGRASVLAWFTVQDDEGHAFVAFSSDAGRSFGPPIRLDDSRSLGRVDVELLEDGSAAAIWIEFAEERAQLRARRVHSDGARSPAVTISGIDANRASGYPRVARQGDELIFAWTEGAGGSLRVQTAAARLGPIASREDM